ncbi:MAG: AAA family ATPase [Planctomycetota bacterium]|jgi:type II secretory pathway predicted ATPase ExeA
MSYLSYWRLSRSPFSLRHPTMDYYLSGSISDALTRVEFLIHHGRRLGILFGPRGVGKSSFFQYFASRCTRFPKRVVGLVDFAGASPTLLARRFRDALQGEAGPERWQNESDVAEPSSLGRSIQEIDELLMVHNSIGRRPLLLLDNADEAAEDIFQTLAILLRRPGHWSAILAVDESHLVEIPRKILQECELRMDLPVWDLGLTAEFFETTQAKCGFRSDVFSAPGIMRIHELGEGIPKRMFQLAELALAVGAERGVNAVDAELIDQVSEENSFGSLLGNGVDFERASR